MGYPLAGLLTELAGLRAAYSLGLVVTVAALGIAILAIPHPPARPARTAAHAVPPPAGIPSGAGAQSGTGAPSRGGPSRAGPPSGAGSQPPLATPADGGRVSLDLPGAFLLAAGLIAVLLAVGDPDLWQRHLSLAGGLLGAAAVLLAAWIIRERRASSPLVDISLLRHPAVARANVVMLAGGAGMYLLLTIITRYVQTPASAGYGFGVSTFAAGLALVPFSVLGFAAGRVTPRLSTRIGPAAVLAVSSVIVAAAFAMFALARADFAEALTAASGVAIMAATAVIAGAGARAGLRRASHGTEPGSTSRGSTGRGSTGPRDSGTSPAAARG
ncbi:MAG TPA: hypothetical protein VGG35_27795 [Streptosporangiaceae bacterium]